MNIHVKRHIIQELVESFTTELAELKLKREAAVSEIFSACQHRDAIDQRTSRINASKNSLVTLLKEISTDTEENNQDV